MIADLLYDLKGELKSQTLRKSYFELGKSFLQCEEWTKAEHSLLEALKDVDNTIEDWKIYRLLAYAREQLRDQSQSRNYMMQAIATAPPMISGQLTSQLPYALEFIDINNEDSDKISVALVLQGEATLYSKQQDFPKAIDRMKQAMQVINTLNDTNRKNSAILNFANIYYESGDFSKAIDTISEIAVDSDYPELPEVKLLRGKCLLAQQLISQAFQVSEDLIRMNFGINAYVLKIQCYLYSSDYKPALETVHNAYTVYPSDTELLFYKMQILVESNFNNDEAFEIFKQVLSLKGDTFIIDKLREPYLRFRKHHGNDNYFLAQVYHWMPSHFTASDGLAEADKALSEGITFNDYDHPQGIIYRLKALIYYNDADLIKSAEFYSLAAKEFYWNRKYLIAEGLFQKAIELNNDLTDTYRYYADNQLLLSYQSEFPYVDEKFLDQALVIWQKGFEKQLPGTQDAWTYLTLARILEQRSLIRDKEKTGNYQSAWLAVEKNILLSGNGYFALTCLSRILREMDGLERCAYDAAKQAERLNKDNFNVWEAVSAISLNLGLWEDGLSALKKLQDTYPDDITYRGWEGFAYYGKKDFPQAAKILTEVINKDPSWAWARLMRMICNWMLEENDLALVDAEFLLEKKDYYLSYHRYFEISFAHFMKGDPAAAFEVCQQAPNETDFEKNKYFYLCVYSAGMNNFTEAGIQYDKYSTLVKVERDVLELQSFLDRVHKGKHLFGDKIEQSLKFVRQNSSDTPLMELEVLKNSSDQYRDSNTNAWLALQLACFRIHLDAKNWAQALSLADLVNQQRKDYSDAVLMYDKYLLNLQAWLFEKLSSGENFDDWSLIHNGTGSIQHPFISVPDTWFIASRLAAHRDRLDLARKFEEMAKEQYTQQSLGDMEINVRRLQETYPGLTQFLSEEDSASLSKTVVCRSCGALVTSSKQKFCYKCGESLFTSGTAPAS